MSSPVRAFAAGTLLAWRDESVGALGADERVVRAQHGAREISGSFPLGRSEAQQQLFADRCIPGQKK